MLGFARTITPKGAFMRFNTKAHKRYCGIDLHARKKYVCILDSEGTVLVHREVSCNRGAARIITFEIWDSSEQFSLEYDTAALTWSLGRTVIEG
jgi:hypothetical protein